MSDKKGRIASICSPASTLRQNVIGGFFTSEMGDFLGGNALPLHQNGDDIFLIQLGKRFPSSNNSVDNGCCSPVTGAFRVNDIVVRYARERLPFTTT